MSDDLYPLVCVVERKLLDVTLAMSTRRERIATAVLAGIYANSVVYGSSHQEKAAEALRQADALMAQLDQIENPIDDQGEVAL